MRKHIVHAGTCRYDLNLDVQNYSVCLFPLEGIFPCHVRHMIAFIMF